MFSFKKKSVALREPDLIWKSRDLKNSNLLLNAHKKISEGCRVLILCHFNQTLRDFSTTLKTLNYPNDFERWTQGYYSELCIGLSENLPEIAWTDSPQERWIFVTEFYPIPLRDEKIVAWAGPYTHIGFYDSMDSPLFKLFGSEQMITLLEGLGWNDTEPMSNSMITKALQNAQKRVLKKMLVDNPAGSSEEWFEINYPKVNSAQ